MATTTPSDDVGTAVLFEDDRLRIWDQVIPHGEICETHVHRLTYFYVVVGAGVIKFVDPDDETQFREMRLTAGQVGFHEIAPGDHKVDRLR